MNTVTLTQLGRKISELLGGINDGEAIEVSKLRNGAILISRADQLQESKS